MKVALLLDNVEVVPVDDGLGKRAGMLLARTGAADAIDASVVCLAKDGDDILTSDPRDLLDLVRTAGVHVELIPVEGLRRRGTTRGPLGGAEREEKSTPYWKRLDIPVPTKYASADFRQNSYWRHRGKLTTEATPPPSARSRCSTRDTPP